MKKILLSVSCYMAFLASYAQHPETRSLPAFTSVRVADNIMVVLVPGDTNKLDLTVKNMMNEKVKTEVAGGEFRISKDGLTTEADVKGILHYTQAPVKLSPCYGGLVKSEEPIVTDKLEIEAKLDGYTNLVVNVKVLTITAGQGADIYVSGRAETVIIDATSGAKVHLESLVCEDAQVKSVLGSKVWLTARQNYTAKAVSGGKIYYSAEPSGKFEKTFTTGGQILME